MGSHRRRVAELLDAVQEMEEAYDLYRTSRRAKRYVRSEHVSFLGNRMATFGEYLAWSNPQNFLHYTRLTPEEFNDLFLRIAGSLEHAATHFSPISPQERLFTFLRYVGHGYSFGALAEELHCGKSTVSKIVSEVADVITNVLFAEAFPPFTQNDLEEIAAKTQQRYDYPRAVGFLDGKHIKIRKPARSGSMYYNYKKTFSIILLALVDCDYRILAFDLGAPGRVGDAGVFRNSTMKAFFENRDDIFPVTRDLAGVGPVQYHILVDSGFAQGKRYVRPFSQAAANTPSKRRFNRKHSGARRVVESTFGILCRRFAILQNAMLVEPDKATKIVTSLLVLHNILARRRNALEHSQRFMAPDPDQQLDPLADIGEGAGAAVLARNRITEYYDIRARRQ